MENADLSAEVITQPEHTPTELAMEIRKYTGDTTQNIIKIVQLLIEAKKKINHGEWEEWLSVNVKFTLRTANRFMKCAERFSKQTTSSVLNSSQMFDYLL